MKDVSENDVALRVTYQCNLRCPWCSVKDHLSDGSSENDDAYLELVQDCLDRNRGQFYAILGGEPLLKFPLVKKITDRIRTGGIDTSISLMTNGLLLTKEMIPWAVEKQVNLNIAINGQLTGYKNISDLLAVDGIMDIIHGIPDTRCTVVINPGEFFAEKIVATARIFRIPISLPLNLFRYDEFVTDNNLRIFELQLMKLRRFVDNHELPDYMFHFPRFFPYRCDDEGIIINPDLTITTCKVDGNGIPFGNNNGGGCRCEKKKIGENGYDTITSMIAKYRFTKKQRGC